MNQILFSNGFKNEMIDQSKTSSVLNKEVISLYVNCINPDSFKSPASASKILKSFCIKNRCLEGVLIVLVEIEHE